VTLAASSRGKAIPLARAKAEGDAKALRHSAERGGSDRGVRGSIGYWRRGKKTPTLGEFTAPETVQRANRGKMAARVQWRSAKAFMGVVKHPVPR